MDNTNTTRHPLDISDDDHLELFAEEMNDNLQLGSGCVSTIACIGCAGTTFSTVSSLSSQA